MALTLAEAAQETGLNRSTVLRAIKSGKISGTRDHNGQWSVEPAELFRVFPAAEAAPKAAPQPAQADVELRVRLQVAEERLSELKQLLQDKDVQHDRAMTDMRAQRDSWQAQAERLAITAQGAQADRQGTAQARTSVPTVQVIARRPWWRRLAG
jgi:excisionase family DNA binding protein